MGTNRAKERYEKPVLQTVSLKAEEVMVVGCKTGGHPAKPNVPSPCGVVQCVLPGS